MAYIEGQDREHVIQHLARLTDPVTIVNFTQQFECQYCRETRQLLEELVELSDKLTLEVYNLTLDNEKAEEFGVDKVPATLFVKDGKDPGIRFYGVPLGYEFVTVLEDLIAVSTGESGLSDATKATLATITQPVDLQVFVTPQCPYCPRAVSLAHMMALESEHVTASMVEATEFPQLANRFNVRGVPRTVINEIEAIEGAELEHVVMERIISTLEPAAPTS